jgi:hypothetical protein
LLARASPLWRRPFLTDAVGFGPSLLAAGLRRRLGKSHGGWGRLWHEQQRTNARNHPDGEHADNATRKI